MAISGYSDLILNQIAGRFEVTSNIHLRSPSFASRMQDFIAGAFSPCAEAVLQAKQVLGASESAVKINPQF